MPTVTQFHLAEVPESAGAMRINIVGGSNTLYYLLKDHLDSASVVTNASGTTVGEQRLRSVPLRRNPLHHEGDHA